MIDGYVRDFAGWTPRATALALPDRRVRFAELDADIDRMADALAARGVAPDAGPIAVAAPRAYGQRLAELALLRLGVVADASAPQRIELTPAEMDAALGAPLHRRDLGLPDPDAPALIAHDGGARIAISRRQLERMAFTALRSCCAGRQGTWVAAGDLPAPALLNFTAAAWAAGAAIAEPPRLEALPAWLAAVDDGVLWITPQALSALLDALPAAFQGCPGWRVVVVTQAALAADLARRARLALGPDLRLAFSPPQAPLCAVGHAADLDAQPGYAGVVLSGVDAGLDPAGRLVLAGPRVLTPTRLETGMAARLEDGRLVLL